MAQEPPIPQSPNHPNEPGKWTRLESGEAVALWRRDRSDPMPVTLFYVLAPPRQAEILYDETKARALFASLTAPDASAPPLEAPPAGD